MAQNYDYHKPEHRAPLESQPIRENFQALATCHAGDAEPPQLWEGMLWLRTTDGVLLQYFSGAWRVLTHVTAERSLGRVYRHIITTSDLANKLITLPPPPVTPDQILVHVEGAPILRRGVDYDTGPNYVTWDGLTLEVLLREGDVLVVQY